MTTTVILPVLEFLIMISLVLVIFKAKVAAFLDGYQWLSNQAQRACLILNACLNWLPGYGTIIIVTVGIYTQRVTRELLSELLGF